MEPGEQGPDQQVRHRPNGGSSTVDPASGGRPARSFGSAAAGAGLQFALSLLVFALLGQWLDRRLGTAPVFLLVCVFVGAGGSIYSMYRMLTAAQRREDEARERQRRESSGGAGGAG